MSRTVSGALRSIMTLPPIMRRLRASAAAKYASAEAEWTEQNATAVVVPCRSSSSRNAPAIRAACAGSLNLASAGKV